MAVATTVVATAKAPPGTQVVAAAPRFRGSVAAIDRSTRSRMRWSWRPGCPVAGTSRWSEHAYGRAIDVNPVQNPYVAGRHVSPPAGRRYADRARRAPGMIHAGDAVVRAFAAAGWGWGGAWRTARDYQHFSASGR